MMASAHSILNVAENPLASTSRSEEHTSELQSQSNLVCRLLLEKKKNILHSIRWLREQLPYGNYYAARVTGRCTPLLSRFRPFESESDISVGVAGSVVLFSSMHR